MNAVASAPQTINAEQARALAGQLLARRRAAQDSTLEFARVTMPGFEQGPHHRLICDALDRVERGECKRLMIFAPPRHGKSELVSRRFVARYFGKHPEHQVLAASHTQDLADDIGHDVREIMRSEEFANVFEGRAELAQDSKAMNKWRTEDGGIYITLGVGGPALGRGANLFVIDDPIKDRAEADSKLHRDKLWRWYAAIARSRLMPGGAVVLMHQRFHEDDLAGRLLAAVERGDEPPWEVLCLPAIWLDENGQERALWPEWYGLDFHRANRKFLCGSGAARDWFSMYQQTPTAEDGTFFHREWFKEYTTAPDRKSLNVYVSSDFAVTPDGGDWTWIIVWGIDPLGNIFFLDSWAGQTSADVWIDVLIGKFRRWKPLFFIGETGPIKRAVEPILALAMRENVDAATACEWLPHGAANKQGNAQAFQGLVAQGRVYFPKTADAVRVVDQCLRFPAGSEDDAVDTCSLLGRFVHKMWAQAPQKPAATSLAEAFSAQPTIKQLMTPPKPKTWASHGR